VFAKAYNAYGESIISEVVTAFKLKTAPLKPFPIRVVSKSFN
jgi:hypothetical protein